MAAVHRLFPVDGVIDLGSIFRRREPAPAEPFRNRNGKKSLRFDPSIIPIGDGRSINLDVGTGAFGLTKQTIYTASAYAYSAMKWRAMKYAEAPLYMARWVDEDTLEALRDNELQTVLDDPSPDYDQAELLRVTRFYRDLTGRCIWHKQRNASGQIARLVPYSGDEFSIQEDPTGDRIYGQFDVANVRGGPRQLAPEEVVFFRETNPYDWTLGVAPAYVALRAAKLAMSTYDSVDSIVKNAVTPSLIVLMEKEWEPDEDEWNAFKQAIYQQANRDRKGVPMVIQKARDVKRPAMTMRDVLPSEVLDRVEATIAGVFGVPAVALQFLVGLRNSPWSQMSEARRMAIEDTIEPMWRADESTLSRMLVHAPVEEGGQPLEEDPEIVIRFDVTKVRGLQQERATQADIQAKARDILTVNERRQLMGFDPLPEGDPRGNEISGPAPTTDGSPAAGSTSVAAASSGTSRKQGDDRLELPREVIWLLQQNATRDSHAEYLTVVGKRLEDDREHILRLAERTLEERHVTAASVERFGEQWTQERKQADPSSVRDFVRELDADTAIEESWLEVITPVIRNDAGRTVENVAARVGLSFDVLQPGIEAYVDRHAAEMVTEVTATTKDGIKKSVREGLEAGDGIPELTRRIENATQFDTARAELIARTETTAVTNQSGRESLEAYQRDSGTRIQKSWLSARDGRVRPEHRALDDGSWHPIDAAFANGLEEPSEPNCRCTLLYRVVEE